MIIERNHNHKLELPYLTYMYVLVPASRNIDQKRHMINVIIMITRNVQSWSFSSDFGYVCYYGYVALIIL